MKTKIKLKNMTIFLTLLLGLGVMFMGTETVWGEYDVPLHWVDIEDEEGYPSGNSAEGSPGSTVEIEAYYPDEGKAFSHWENSEGTIENVEARKTRFKFDDEHYDKWYTVTVIYRKILVGDIPDQVYTGKAITPDVGNVELEGIDAVLEPGLDYKVEYKNNTAVGTATAHIEIYYGDRGGSCKGHIIKTFKIVRPEDFTRAEVDVENKVYTGKAIKPPIEVRWKGRKLKEGVDYTMSYKNNVNVGTVIVRLTGKGNFTGIVDTSFEIKQRPVTITVANASKVEGKADPAFKGTVKGLVKSGDLGTITYKRTGGATKPGTYKGVLTATYKANPNYTVTVKKGNFTIKAKPEPAKVSGLLVGKVTPNGKTGLTYEWSKVKGAAGYDIFFAECNHGSKEMSCRLVKSIKGNSIFSWTKTGLQKRTPYKAYFKAYVMKNGKKTYVRTSPMLHTYTSGYTRNFTSAKAVTVNKTKVTLKKGKSFKIRANVKKLKKNRQLMAKGHAPKIRYLTTNRKVATVSGSGKISAKGKGTCSIYAFAHNGVYKTVKVTVK